MKNYIRGLKDKDSELLYWVYLLFVYVKRYHVFSIPVFFVMVFYSYFISFRLFGFSLTPRVCFPLGLYRIRLDKDRRSKAIIKKGFLVFEKWRSGATTTILLKRESRLEILNTFVLGDNCKVSLDNSSYLKICGKSVDQLSGITSDSILLCASNIEIGEGSILSWNCYISDSSQHIYNGELIVDPVIIGANVWLSEGVTLSPGTIIGSGSVVGAKSFVKGEFPSNVFLAGSPAKIKKTNISWRR